MFQKGIYEKNLERRKAVFNKVLLIREKIENLSIGILLIKDILIIQKIFSLKDYNDITSSELPELEEKINKFGLRFNLKKV